MSAFWWVTSFLAVFVLLLIVFSGGTALDPLLVVAVLGLLLSALFLAYQGIRQGRLVLGVLGRGLLVLLPIVIAAGLPMALVLYADGLDTRLRQALLAGLVVVLGWLTTFVFQEVRIARDRRDREVELLSALKEEIGNYLYKQGEIDFPGEMTKLEEALEVAETDVSTRYDRFYFTEPEPQVFKAVISELPLLNTDCVRWLVRFYAQLEDIAQLSRDLREPYFLELPAKRRIKTMIKFVQMRQTSVELGHRAREYLDSALPERSRERLRNNTGR